MEVEVKHLEGCKRSIRITLPSERAEEVYNELLNDFRRGLRVPGFRKGKVPEGLIRKRFASELRQEVMSKLIPEAMEEAIRSESLHPVERPTLDEVDYHEGSPLRISASFEVSPEIELEKYAGLSVSIRGEPYRVRDEHVDEEIEKLRRRAATFTPLGEERPARAGDFALVDLRGEAEAEEAVPFRREGVLVAVGKGEIGGLAARLVGAEPGRRLEFTIEHPDDYEDPALAGRSVRYTVDVHELKERVLPDADDEFAKDLGQFAGLEELRSEIRRQLEAEMERRRRGEIEEKLIEAIIDSNPGFELPAVAVQRQMAAREEVMRRRIAESGADPDHIGFDWSGFRKAERPAAELAVRRELLLQKIAGSEGIEVSPGEVSAELAALAAARGEDPKELRRRMIGDGSFESMRAHMREHAVLAWLIENNEINES